MSLFSPWEDRRYFSPEQMLPTLLPMAHHYKWIRRSGMFLTYVHLRHTIGAWHSLLVKPATLLVTFQPTQKLTLYCGNHQQPLPSSICVLVLFISGVWLIMSLWQKWWQGTLGTRHIKPSAFFLLWGDHLHWRTGGNQLSGNKDI